MLNNISCLSTSVVKPKACVRVPVDLIFHLLLHLASNVIIPQSLPWNMFHNISLILRTVLVNSRANFYQEVGVSLGYQVCDYQSLYRSQKLSG